MWKFIVFLIISALLNVNGQILQNGQCATSVSLENNFDIGRFLGTWYEIRNTETPWSGDCATFEFDNTSTGTNNYIAYYRSVNQNFLQEQFGSATVQSNAQISLSLPQVSSQPINFWVQLTNYVNFALIYGCENVGNTQRRVYYWQLSRDNNFNAFPNVPAAFNTTMVNTAGIQESDLREVNHGNNACLLLPVLQAGQPIIVPGTCDQSITGIANFSVGDFLGVWHEVNSYYSENVFGTCGRAQYSDGGSVVNIVNSQINSSRLLTIEGFASLVGNDGRARLNVTLEVVPGVLANSELFVLGTDYNQWAVSYTCVNLPNNNKQLFSWIVSRTRVLPEWAREEVNQVIDSFVELNRQYYRTTDQSEEGCFYAPEPQAQGPVVFGGQCAKNVIGITNFNAGLYLGPWYEIEAYPSLNTTGSCVKADYTDGDGVVNVVNTQVVNQRLETATATAVPVNGSQLLVTFTFPGTNVTFDVDYVVLATDYTNFALVYSCTNINDYQQRVVVWKLSRSKRLNLDSNNAINNTIANSLPVIQEQYFQETDQSTEACFYLPEPNGKVVRIPGQCEQYNTTVVQSFNLTRFSGLWYEVETYPKDQQQGVCINHQFGFVSNSQLSIESSSVVDQLPSVNFGSLILASSTLEGRFTLSVQTSAGNISFPYNIIATDYEDYALAYSCANDGNEFMNVYSWKLSRTPQLSPSAVNNIATATANIVIIDQRYFEPVPQDNNACFTFPANLAQGSPVTLEGQCGNVQPLQNFNAAEYLGRWHLIDTYPSDNQGGSCSTQDLRLVGTSVEVTNAQIVNQTFFTDIGIATLANFSIALLEVQFPNAPVPFQLYVLDTDYTSYSLVYGCVNLNNNTFRVYSWKLSRSKTLNQAAFNAIQTTVDSIPVLNNRYYVRVDQSTEGCFYYPPVGAPVVMFPGKCDESVQVVNDFNATEYLGLWYDLQSYPLPFLSGTCPNAEYTLGANGVNVFNTQVVNQTLDTIAGLAVLTNASSTEGKLTVSFPSIGGFTSPYWILATDYVDYAIVYSCQNFVNAYGEDQRQVSSWVLSRTKSLSANASAAYLNATNTIQVLDDRYYIPRDQSDEGCFYYPTPEPGKPVVFNGRCSRNISVIPNLNLTRFSGLWHEIETYPKVQQTGECIRHEFSIQSGDTLGLQSFNVIAESLGITNGVVSRNDSSGRLTINFNTNGTSYEIDYWVIDTDYDNYALVYSCEDYNDNTRGVFSWKLSRSKELLNTSTQAIASALLNIDVLQEQYYEPVDQSDKACFYYPDLAPGESVLFPGQCANITPISNFNASRYLGTWKLIETYPSNFQNGACGEAEYSLEPGGTVVVYNTEVINQTLQVDVGSAVLVDSDKGLFVVNFPNSPQSQELLVLDTDYESYSIVYACANINSDQRRVFSWKLSRTNTLDANANAAINAVLNRTDVLDQRYYVRTDRSAQACFYYPEATGAPVRFRAQCDQNIQVVTGFNPVAYEGLWYDIGSYPTPDQGGQCSNAHYTLGPNGVDVFNTQVINQTLDTIVGLAVLANSSSTEAKLLVNFPSQGPSLSDYWVLATDYTSYALVYSCTNINDEYSLVFSWKLSRTKFLTDNAVTNINNAISRVPVLADRYYIPKNQSDDACFYFPEPKPGVPVRFPGTCENDLPVTPNFSLTRFEGTWYEIETYPKEQQTGRCISHEFTVSGNSFNLISNNVVNGIPGATNGTVNFVGQNETSGRFVITIQSNGSSIEIPYWIIDTDYDNYALAYSCVNVVNERGLNERAVYSWKLSRSQILNATSNQAINNVTTDIDVIDNRYFEEVGQNEDACFYVPDLNPGDPIIYPGQCGNVQGVANFSAGEYLGTWNLIENYASGFQFGTCADATYSLNPDSSVEVVNTEVINQTLSTMIGRAVLVQGSSGVLSVTFPNAPPIDYVILDTDYRSYSLVYACLNINPTQRRVYSWKLSRDDSLSPAAITAIDAAINKTNVLEQRFYEVVNRTYEDCFYFPEPSDNPVEFRGPCDPNVTVVEDFDAGRYLGKWNLIENYPSQFQFGTCATAEYSLDTVAGTVIAVNQEVVNQTLMTDIGTATVIGNGKLSVMFPNAPSPIEYWVLDTDYTSYALVYSCDDRDNGRRRRVNSWKMSRTNELPSVNTINETISRVEVLDQRYYKTVDRSYEGCFYYPEVTGGSVQFRGQCDPNIAVVANFDAGRYLGKWNLIENYPSDFQIGTCATAEYSLDTVAGTVIAVNQEVVNQTLMTDIGTATVIGNAKLSVTFPNAPVPIEYWVLDTDYDSYAIVYSCVDFNQTNTKRVYSWKLSRENTLSQSSINAIDAVLDRVNVLDQRYYEKVDRTDAGCFYYPEPSDNPVIFTGSCATNVNVVQNFDVARYAGTWYQIERYPQTFEDTNSTCAGARYQFNENEGVVNVVNWEVRNGTLYALEGTAVPASDDGSANLTVTLPDLASGDGTVQSSLYVLTTDYDNYALAYSCANLDGNRRSIGAWKLSRERTLSVAGHTAINNAMDPRPELVQKYFRRVQQNESCPEPSSGTLVRSSITIVLLLTLTQYLL